MRLMAVNGLAYSRKKAITFSRIDVERAFGGHAAIPGGIVVTRRVLKNIAPRLSLLCHTRVLCLFENAFALPPSCVSGATAKW